MYLSESLDDPNRPGATLAGGGFTVPDRMAIHEIYRADAPGEQLVTFLGGIFGLTANSVASTIQLSILGVGGWLVIEGNLTIGTLSAFLGLMGQIIGPMQSFSGVIQALQQATGA